MTAWPMYLVDPTTTCEMELKSFSASHQKALYHCKTCRLNIVISAEKYYDTWCSSRIEDILT